MRAALDVARAGGLDEYDGLIWRVLLSDHLRASRREIEQEWSLDALMEAHVMLDALDAASHAQTAKR